MNIKERINFYNSLATSSPVIYQKNKVPDTRFRLSEGIIKICGKYNIKPIILNNNSEDTNRNAAENTAYDDKTLISLMLMTEYQTMLAGKILK